MTINYVSLSQLVPSKANPRKAFDDSAIDGLAASIKEDGLLQNLVVRPTGGKGKRYAIISGERRYRALKLLEGRGDLPDDFTVPVDIRTRLTKDERLRLATVENLQRADLSPLEETAALTKLIHQGTTLEDVAAQTGLSPTTIKRRLALNCLCGEAKVALDEGTLSLAQAEALSLGNDEAQHNILEDVERGYNDWSASGIKSMLLDNRPCVADAIFPLEQYTGTITTDLFAEGETSYFDDEGQFYDLQKEAVIALANSHEETAAWVEITDHWRISTWQYEKAEDGEQGGVIINLAPDGTVEIADNLIKPEIDEEMLEQTAENTLAPPRKKATYSAPVRQYIAHHKSVAVQELLLSSPRKAKEVAVVQMFMGFKPHEGLVMLAKEYDRQPSYAVIEQAARRCALLLGLPLEDEQHGWEAFARYEDDDVLYRAVKGLSDPELDEMQTLLTAMTFGQKFCNQLDCEDSFFNLVAIDLEADMRNHWRPDRSFLSRRNRAQLIEVSKGCGHADGRSAIGSYKKSELVEGILYHIANAQMASTPTEAQHKALTWLPEAMQFPAVDPDDVDDDLPDADAEQDVEEHISESVPDDEIALAA